MDDNKYTVGSVVYRWYQDYYNIDSQTIDFMTKRDAIEHKLKVGGHVEVRLLAWNCQLLRP